ncbi:MAG: hypothetical protein KGJ59_11250 [Bacteroidota bacterium]|nr:hypothetical protein [Bacteroidota bacterium]
MNDYRQPVTSCDCRLLVIGYWMLAIILAATGTLYSQVRSAQDSTLRTIDRLFTNGSYLSAELEARRLLEIPGISDSVKAQGEKYIAFSLVAQGKNEAATEHFIDAMKLDSVFSLDPVLTSPKIMSVYRDAREKFLLHQQQAPIQQKENLHEEGTRGPTLRALIFPGWEQLYQGKSVKGYVLLGAGAVSLASTLYFDQIRKDKRSSYLAASTPTQATALYPAYNSAYKAENYSAAIFGIIYLYSTLDAFISLPPHFDISVSSFPASALSLRYSW